MLKCNACGHVAINELVDIREFGYGDNTTEYMLCPKCGQMHPLLTMEWMTSTKGEMSHV